MFELICTRLHWFCTRYNNQQIKKCIVSQKSILIFLPKSYYFKIALFRHLEHCTIVDEKASAESCHFCSFPVINLSSQMANDYRCVMALQIMRKWQKQTKNDFHDTPVHKDNNQWAWTPQPKSDPSCVFQNSPLAIATTYLIMLHTLSRSSLLYRHFSVSLFMTVLCKPKEVRVYSKAEHITMEFFTR